jgi:hypothetical protein
MKRTFMVLLAAFTAALFLTTGASPAGAAQAQDAQGGTLRESLAALSTVEKLYSIDDLHTYVLSRGPVLNKAVPYGYTLLRISRDGPMLTSIIRHDAPQPIVYKSRALPPASELAGLPAGEISLADSSRGGPATGQRLYTGADLYQHAYSACLSTGGTPSFVVPKRHGGFKRLTRVSALKAFVYIEGSGARGDGVWYLACDGVEKFVVEKQYRFLSKGADVAEVTYKRTLAGISYVEDTQNDDAVFTASRPAPAPGEPTGEFLEEMAREVVRMGGRLVKVKGGARFSGSYTKPQSEKDCGRISIKHVWSQPEVEESMVKVYDFKHCRGTFESLGERSEAPSPKKSEFANLPAN